MSERFIEVKNITKYYKIKRNRGPIRNILFPSYRDFLAVKDINFDVKKNEIFGILGPNGAGKTTIVKIICGLLEPSSGAVFINKKNVEKNFFYTQSMIGAMFGITMIYRRLTGYDNLKYYCKVYNIRNSKDRVKELLELVDLVTWQNQLVEHYSLGMKSKLALARSLVHDPKILILDEPTLGLDVKNSRYIRELLKQINKTIIITTHNMDVANDVCNRIALLSKGNIIEIDTPENLKRKVISDLIVEIETSEIDSLIKGLKTFNFIESIKQVEKFKIQVFFKYKENLQTILNFLSNKNIFGVKTITPSLEDVFFKFTGEKKIILK